MQGRLVLLNSVQPALFGKYPEKLGVLLSLIGGVIQQQGQRQDAVKVRGCIHLLMIGEPGTGKSKLLHAAY